MNPIITVARKLGIPKKYLELYGNYKAKISLDIFHQIAGKKLGKYVVVTGMTPTHLGEGKTVTTIGLSMALNRAGKSAVCCLRQPSLGPFFGIKGGGVGGGKSHLLPGEDINLHLTGDIHAIAQAHNLCSAFLDNSLYRKNPLNIDPERIYWRRVIDSNDRALRSVRIGLGGGENGVERDTGFDITAASEIMAILALTNSIGDMRKRLTRIVTALSKDKRPVTAQDLKVAGAMSLLLRDAIKPNLVQTSEGTPCIIHTGPFANITHGNSSIIADQLGLRLADYVVTESGFGADCGFEKFVNIKSRTSGLKPNAAVLVSSVRAIKAHSGLFKLVVGKPLGPELAVENLDAVRSGFANLAKQIENVRIFGVPCVVAINRFETDSERELEFVKNMALASGALDCVISEVFERGSKGGIDLAKAVIKACKEPDGFRFLYPNEMPLKEKIRTIAKKIYGARDVSFEPMAEEDIALFEKLGFGDMPVCMAKTHLSLSHDPNLKGRPEGFILPVRDVRPSIGAGFLYALCGKVLTMPSLPSKPVGENMDIDSNGNSIGIF